jgi:pimeloyl-ACP methyl ester carboxylesterase
MHSISSSTTTHTEPQGARTGLRVLVWLRRVLFGLLLTFLALALSGAAYQAIATALDRRAYPPPGQLVDVGGYRIHLHSIGENQGNPTVILIACGGCTSANWGWVQPAVARFTRVVAYDRAGFGWSEPGPEPRDALRNVRELHTALGLAGIPGPYVLVGHSYGGPIARVYAAQYPDEVAGMVLVDPRHPDQDARFPAEAKVAMESEGEMVAMLRVLARFGVLRLTDEGKEHELPERQNAEYNAFHDSTQYWDSLAAQGAAIAATDAETRGAGSLGRGPLAVLSADRAWWTPGAPPDETRRVYTELNIEQAALSSNSIHRVVAGASHTSLVNNQQHAQITIDTIRQVVAAARADQPLAR